MRVLEVRRHSLTKRDRGGSQLSQEGVDLAREIGESMGPFARVVATVSPRARETAIAMGFAVDFELVTLALDPEIYADVRNSPFWGIQGERFFGELADLVQRDGALGRYAHSLAALWRDLLTPLQDGENVLVISHSGDLETPLVACFPRADHASWGRAFAPCEGARITFDDHFVDVEFIRLE
jgi:broad specificity phosphatase PhoE